MVDAAPRFQVYHTATPTKVSVVAITVNAQRSPIETPASLAGVRNDTRHVERLIRDFSGTLEAHDLTPPGGQLEWSLRFSTNSLRFDRIHIIITKVGDDN